MNYRNHVTDTLCDAILSLTTREDCYRFFEDVCTIKEILDIAQRLDVARMLSEGQSYADITRQTGMSTTTISRVNRCLKYGSGGYRMALEALAAPRNPREGDRKTTYDD